MHQHQGHSCISGVVVVGRSAFLKDFRHCGLRRKVAVVMQNLVGTGWVSFPAAGQGDRPRQGQSHQIEHHHPVQQEQGLHESGGTCCVTVLE